MSGRQQWALTWALSLALLGPANAGGEESVGDAASVAAPDRVVDTLQHLARHYPEHAELVTYGKSGGGRPLLALRVRAKAGDPGGPLVAVVSDLWGPDPSAKVLAALESELRSLVLADEDGGGAGLGQLGPLQDRIWILSPDPDRAAGEAAAGRPDPVLDFPAGWDPWVSGARSGPYPYSTPEAAALGALLDGEEALASVVVVSAGETLWESAPGSLERFCEEHLMVRTERCSKRLAGRLGKLDEGRPRLALSGVRTRPLGEGRWLIDVVAENRGVDALELPAPLPKLRLGGARLVALAISGDQVAYEVTSPEHMLAGLEPGAVRSLRLVIDVSGQENPLLELCGPRWRSVRHALAIAPLRPR